MGKILDNPREFFENLTDEEFKQLLDKYIIEYADMKDLTQEEKNSLYKKVLAK